MANTYPNQRFSTNLSLALFGMDEALAENMEILDSAFGAGSSLNVNGTLVTSPNLNGILPAAPAGKSNVIWQFDVNGNVSAYYTPGSGGGGTVTSVAMTGDGTIFNSVVSGSPITTAGTLAPSLLTQTANTVLAGPTSGGALAPTFRSLVAGDIPSLPYIPTSVMTTLGDTIYGGASGVATRLAGNTTTTKQYLSQTGAAGPVSAAPVWAQIAIGDLANIAGGTVLGNTGTSAGAVAATIAPVLGIPGTSTGTIALASSTASGKFTITAPASAATPTLTLPTSSGVAVNVADGTVFTATIAATGTLALATQTANFGLFGPTSGAAAAPTFRAMVNADLPANTLAAGQGFWGGNGRFGMPESSTASQVVVTTAEDLLAYLIYIPQSMTVKSLSASVTAAQGATAVVDFGMYPASAGSTITFSTNGGINGNSATVQNVGLYTWNGSAFVSAASVTLAIGWYYFAVTSTIGISTMRLACFTNNSASDPVNIVNKASGSITVGIAASGGSSGKLPGTLPTLSALSGSQARSLPAVWISG